MLTQQIKIISSEEVQQYLFANSSEDEKKLLLRQKEIFGLSASSIAQQIGGRKKVEGKLPLFYKTKGVIYPPSLNLEQSSSEATAKFKADIVRIAFNEKKVKVADLTGGFGIDSFFLSKVASSIDYVEPDKNLINIVRHNHPVLGATNINYYNDKAEDFLLRNTEIFDLIYLDPSRRDSQNKKIFRLSNCLPNVVSLLPQLFNKSDFVLLKASPLLDIKQGLEELNFVKTVFVVAVDNECKELLFLLQKNIDGSPSIEAVNLENNGALKHYFGFNASQETAATSNFSEPETYLYEPNAAILKAGAFKSIGNKFDLRKIHPGTHLYSSYHLRKDFPGRIFQIQDVEFDSKKLAEKKANIITRNFPMKPEELKKKFKLADGGENYVIAFSGVKKKYIVLATRLA